MALSEAAVLSRVSGSREPADLRLVLPAVSAWAAAFTVLGLAPDHRPLLPPLAGLAAALALLLLAVPAQRRRRTALLLAATLLTGAAATVTTLLHTADLHRGPLPALAHAPAPTESSPELTVSLTIAGDPKAHTSHSRGTAPGQSLLTVSAVVDSVTLPQPLNASPGTSPNAPPEPPALRTVRTRTPVTVMVRAQDADGWRDLIPSTRLRADVRVTPTHEGVQTAAAVLLARGSPELLAPPSLPQRLASRLRSGLRAACDHLPADTRGLLPGLVVGDTSRLPDDLDEAFRATDLGHLTAVSGANLMIVLTVLIGMPGQAGTPGRGGLAGRLGLPLRTTAVLGTVLTLAFVTVCRPDPSVLRAAATGLVGLLALGTGRPRQALPALAAAVLGLVLLDPYLARSYGFVLSVLATTGLLTLGPRWTAALTERRWPHHLATAVAATAAAQALCAPVTILLAPRVSLVAVPCNLLAEPAVAPTTLLGFAALVVDPLSHTAAGFLVGLAALPVAWLAGVARYGAALPGAQLAWPEGPFGAALLAVATLALAWAVRPFLLSPAAARRARPAAHRFRAALAAVLGLTILAVLLRPPLLTRLATGWPPKGWQLVMCDIGQGDMTVLPIRSTGEDTPDSAIVVDTGPDPHAADTCLRELGITRVPLLILSHFHADHAEGLPGVLRGRRVGALQVTTLETPVGEYARVLAWAAAARVPILRAQRGEHRFAGAELSWDVLWPDDTLGPGTPGANNASIALLASAGPRSDPLSIALLGDLEPPAQAALRARMTPPRVDVLKVAHHGSGHQDGDLTDALHPHLALISCGTDNPYGHPAAQTVAHLRSLGTTVLRTDQVGDIAVLGTPATLRAATHPHGPAALARSARAPPSWGRTAHRG
ncbi:ComEC/Rec2 family competence protein [Kitasatospora sp. GP82]|uniref:ComEC/Rec2 family competence protein n=1 Tax=Kitasatospora sp. GP82 TaxID=3035089 RepID=UPI0024739FAD|nr:ComEC/Rec2 family competence protein [Kitasatospora sp. GP82]MDH6125195.1 competence protein ComEC [Kitasatospora sp. GP82]